jgi:hypothetical protein
MKVNGWTQLRHAAFDSDGPNRSRNTLLTGMNPPWL